MNHNTININSSQTVIIASSYLNISSGHSAYIVPPTFGAVFGVNSFPSGFSYIPYAIYWFENGTLLGYTDGNAVGIGATTTIGVPMNSAAQSFFSSAHQGPTKILFQVEVYNVISSNNPSVLVLYDRYLDLTGDFT